MSFKEVNELRKSGQLQDAYEMAQADWNQMPDDIWTARALFWTLHDMAYNELRQGNRDEAQKLSERMTELLPTLGDAGEVEEDSHPLPERALDRLTRHMQPFYHDIKLAYNEARLGDTIAPYDFVAQLIVDGQLAEPLHERAGWIIWYHLWKQQQRMPSQEARQALAHYLSLTGIARPSSLHSRILSVALNLSKRFIRDFNLVKFIELWDLDNLMDEDWERSQQKNNSGKTYPSLVESTITHYINFKKQYREMDYDDRFFRLLGEAVERYPDKPEFMRYQSLVYFHRGDKERSLKLHRKLAQRHNRYYVWHELASMLTHDLDMKTSALCQSLTLKVPDNYTCDIHRELGWELSREGDMPAALCELLTYSAIRERFGWKKSWRFDQLRKRIPADTIPAADNRQLYTDRSQLILDWVYQEIPMRPAVVMLRFVDKQGQQNAKLALVGGKTMFVKAHQLKTDSRYLDVRVNDDNGRLRLIAAQPAERDRVVAAFAEEAVTGQVRIFQGQGGKCYGFVEGCFVPGTLLEGIASGDSITILTEPQHDGRRRATAII